MILDTLESAWRSMSRNGTRALLSAACIAVGIGAVTTMLAVGNGTRAEIRLLMERTGMPRFDIASGKNSMGGMLESEDGRRLLIEDVAAIGKVNGVIAVVPRWKGNAEISAGRATENGTWEGVDERWFSTFQFEMVAGRALNESDYRSSRRVAVISSDIAESLFGKANASVIGKKLHANGTSVAVVGVFDPSKTKAVSNLANAVIVPKQMALQRLLPSDEDPRALSSIVAVVGSDANMKAIEDDIRRVMRKRHSLRPGQEEDFSISSLADMLKSSQEADKQMATMLAIVGAVALFIAGVGIMNVMLVSLKERMKEIAVSMAIGATPKRIRNQFLAETMVLVGMGTLAGLGLAVGGCWAVETFSALTVKLGVGPVLVSTAFAIFTGIAAGLVPALRASGINIIETLRA